MSIITDGTNPVTFAGTQVDDFQNIEQGTSRTGGGGNRTIVAGRRFIVLEQFRSIGTVLKSLLELLTNGSDAYFYTPSVIPDHMDSSDFPMSVKISKPEKRRQGGGGDKKYFYEMKIEGVEYL